MTKVSVIIPTAKRPKLLRRALDSAFAQTMHDIEVIVVVDGPNEETLAMLGGEQDCRLRILHNPSSIGPGAARNAGAAIARGQWLAFLDDDDEWMPRKLEVQLAAGERNPNALITCRCQVITPRGTFVWPRRIYDGSMPIDEYAFDRRSIWRGDSYLATPTFFLRKDVFMRSRFGTTSQHEDTTLLLRVTKEQGGKIIMLPDVLVVIHAEQSGGLSQGSNFAWREVLGWADGMGALLTRRAYSGLCLVTLASQAKVHSDYAAIPVLWKLSWQKGAPTPMQILVFSAFWLVPMGPRRALRAFVLRWSKPHSA